jgi:hypothetical protein
MATGDQADFVNRLAGLLPASWFEPGAGNNPVRDAELNGAAFNLSWIYSLYSYTLLQTRIATATGVWLDRIAWDFFGPAFARSPGETDDTFRVALKAEILRPRQTRAAILIMLQELTGNSGTVHEPWNPYDWGGYSEGVCGYGIALGYGSLQYNNQILVTAVRPNGEGIPIVAGYGMTASGYGVGNGPSEYCDISQMTGPVPDSEIYSRIAQTVAAGITAWTAIESSSNTATGSMVEIGTQNAAMAVLQSWF